MPKKPRRPVYLQGHYYHIYDRGTWEVQRTIDQDSGG